VALQNQIFSEYQHFCSSQAAQNIFLALFWGTRELQNNLCFYGFLARRLPRVALPSNCQKFTQQVSSLMSQFQQNPIQTDICQSSFYEYLKISKCASLVTYPYNLLEAEQFFRLIGRACDVRDGTWSLACFL
jgi:hypothetical protein